MAPRRFTPAWLRRSIAPIHNSRSGFTGFFTKTGTSTPRSESASACMANGLAEVRAPIQRMSMSYLRASSTCSGVATSVLTSILVSFFTRCIQGSAFSPLPWMQRVKKETKMLHYFLKDVVLKIRHCFYKFHILNSDNLRHILKILYH